MKINLLFLWKGLYIGVLGGFLPDQWRSALPKVPHREIESVQADPFPAEAGPTIRARPT